MTPPPDLLFRTAQSLILETRRAAFGAPGDPVWARPRLARGGVWWPAAAWPLAFRTFDGFFFFFFKHLPGSAGAWPLVPCSSCDALSLAL